MVTSGPSRLTFPNKFSALLIIFGSNLLRLRFSEEVEEGLEESCGPTRRTCDNCGFKDPFNDTNSVDSVIAGNCLLPE